MPSTTFRLILAATAVAALASPAAIAASWTPTDSQDADAPRVIYTETDSGAALLACSADGKLSATLSDQNTDFAQRMKKNAPYRRGVDVVLTVGEKTTDEARWSLMPAVDVIFSSSHNQAAQLFNATVRGEALTVTVNGDDYTSMTLPPVDETFRAFSRTCRG